MVYKLDATDFEKGRQKGLWEVQQWIQRNGQVTKKQKSCCVIEIDMATWYKQQQEWELPK